MKQLREGRRRYRAERPKVESVVERCRVWSRGEPIPAGYAKARDGLPARKQGSWARDKLKFLDHFMDGALGATRGKRGHVHYVDLFAGPGWTVSEQDRQFPGSPIRALDAAFRGKGWTGRFNGFHYCNLDRFDYGLLEARLDHRLHEIGEFDRREVIHHYQEDANKAVFPIMSSIPTWAYVLVFADIEGPSDLPFRTVEELRRRHDSVDLYVLFPTGLNLQRMLPYQPAKLERFAAMWTDYFGTEEWRSVVGTRVTEKDHPRIQAGLRDLYIERLRTLWKDVEVKTEIIKDGRKRYDMIFACSHAAASSISSSAARSVQKLGLFDGLEDDPLSR